MVRVEAEQEVGQCGDRAVGYPHVIAHRGRHRLHPAEKRLVVDADAVEIYVDEDRLTNLVQIFVRHRHKIVQIRSRGDEVSGVAGNLNLRHPVCACANDARKYHQHDDLRNGLADETAHRAQHALHLVVGGEEARRGAAARLGRLPLRVVLAGVVKGAGDAAGAAAAGDGGRGAAAEAVGRGLRTAARVEDEKRDEKGDLEEVVESDAKGGVDGEVPESWQGGEGADEEGENVGDGSDGNGGAGGGESMSHSLRNGQLRVGVVVGIDDHKHVVHADAEHEEGQHAHEGAVEETQGGADTEGADDGHADGEDATNAQQPSKSGAAL
mmetsp:Transcript_37254/g.66684  ORF Transcript_37254/g.66684 Transcript_37254/m.66684 type:complete len:325 (+) Transcript_37254:1171-2145(+)